MRPYLHDGFVDCPICDVQTFPAVKQNSGIGAQVNDPAVFVPDLFVIEQSAAIAQCDKQ